MTETLLQYVGYAASIAIAISMMVNSIVKFRWINLIGAFVFSLYGFIFRAYPVALLNGFIVLVDLYYLSKIYSKKEVFEILEIQADNKYLIRFLDFHNEEIQKFFPGFSYKPELNTMSFFTLRNMSVAGIFLAHKNGDTLSVGLDYVIPAYRDFKNGQHIYLHVTKKFADSGIRKIVSSSNSKEYSQYLKKLGFTLNSSGIYEKILKD